MQYAYSTLGRLIFFGGILLMVLPFVWPAVKEAGTSMFRIGIGMFALGLLTMILVAILERLIRIEYALKDRSTSR